MKKQYSTVGTAVLYGMFFIYLFMLLYVLLLSRIRFGYWSTSSRSVNLVPFYTISEYVSGGIGWIGGAAFSNIVLNVLMFVPLGLYLAVLRRGRGLFLCWSITALFSLSAEVAQWIFAVGAADIDDVILNALGGAIGVLLYKLLVFVLAEDKRARSFVAAASVIIGVPALYVAARMYF